MNELTYFKLYCTICVILASRASVAALSEDLEDLEAFSKRDGEAGQLDAAQVHRRVPQGGEGSRR